MSRDGPGFHFARTLWSGLGLPKPHPVLTEFADDPDSEEEAARFAKGDFARLFFAHRGRPIHKWRHYLDVYENYISRYRDKPITMLEIGVSLGGSLELWREYFGDGARIFGIDIDPACAQRVTPPNQVRIGSQEDTKFLGQVIAEMGPPDLIIDDGSHVARHQVASFKHLFPQLKVGGLYIVEDVHTAYWPEFYDFRIGKPRSFIAYVRSLMDDMHGWYHYRKQTTPAMSEIGAIHVHDSVVVIEKTRNQRPRQIGAPLSANGLPVS